MNLIFGQTQIHINQSTTGAHPAGNPISGTDVAFNRFWIGSTPIFALKAMIASIKAN